MLLEKHIICIDVRLLQFFIRTSGVNAPLEAIPLAKTKFIFFAVITNKEREGFLAVALIPIYLLLACRC